MTMFDLTNTTFGRRCPAILACVGIRPMSGCLYPLVPFTYLQDTVSDNTLTLCCAIQREICGSGMAHIIRDRAQLQQKNRAAKLLRDSRVWLIEAMSSTIDMKHINSLDERKIVFGTMFNRYQTCSNLLMTSTCVMTLGDRKK